MTLARISEGAYADAGALRGCTGGALVFDCDGVLIDVRDSYDLAIARTAEHVLGTLGVRGAPGVDARTIEGFKATGGFNNEVDLAYAAVISAVAAARLGTDGGRLVQDVIANADSTGIASVESYLSSLADISAAKSGLAYPGDGTGPLSRTFDQLFYGQDLYRRIFAKESGFPGPGLIERDRVVLDAGLLASLCSGFGGRVAMVTGRGRESAAHSLGGLMGGFDLANSFFLEDEPREMAKPNPEPLLRAVRGMGRSSALYVGDSAEDLIMAGRASKAGTDVLFCGITGSSGDPRARRGMFVDGGAAAVLDSIRLLPKVLNLDAGGNAW